MSLLDKKRHLLMLIKEKIRTRCQKYRTYLMWKNNAPIFPSCRDLARRKRGATMSDLFHGNRGYRQSRDVPRAVVVFLPSLLRVQTLAKPILPFFWLNTANIKTLNFRLNFAKDTCQAPIDLINRCPITFSMLTKPPCISQKAQRYKLCHMQIL